MGSQLEELQWVFLLVGVNGRQQGRGYGGPSIGSVRNANGRDGGTTRHKLTLLWRKCICRGRWLGMI